jgi:dihydroorotase
LLIRGGLVLTGSGMVNADVLVEGDGVTAIGLDLQADSEIDASGCWVGPGLVDLHTHLRQPGFEWKEDIASGSRAAAAGGYTAVLAMPNTEPAVDSGAVARFVASEGRSAGLCEVAVAGAISAGRNGEYLAHLDELWEAGARIFTDDGNCLANSGLLRAAMEYLAGRGGVIAQHCEDTGLSDGGHMHEGAVSSLLGIGGIPALAEESILARDLALVRLTGVAYHAMHLSTAGSVDLIARAKAEGLPVTAEATPHHLTFDDATVRSLDPTYKMYPPLRGIADLEALRSGVAGGVIDAVATDHAPHAPHECEVPFEEAPRGVIGLETAAAAVNTALSPTPEVFFDRMSTAPARIARLQRHGLPVEPGGPANLVVFAPGQDWIPVSFISKSANSPFLGAELRGRVMHTIWEGKVTHSTVEARA